ncbi:MAG TPA: hypothetical protein HA283_02335 [Nanoarchaeota archaeon]|nr:hypothetical protein [Nanoarchaeota archaeon]HIH63114.1 hypothetical protein [Nanoarchaeota archaeon]HIJ09187.1 hypothetical protein [Nanoarchaeota archaeon]
MKEYSVKENTIIINQDLKTDLDYVEFYAKKLLENNNFFVDQKKLINSQLKSSKTLFSRMFGKKKFKKEARIYLKKRNII